MTDERAIEILDPEHREHYESIEPVEEACRIGIAAIKRAKELEAENAEFRARLEKAAEEVDKIKKIIEPTMYTSFCGFVVRWCTLEEHKELYGTQEAAEARLKELKENNND